MNLRDHLLNALATLPGSRAFHLHVLVSSPRKFSGLYPYATPTLSQGGKQRKPPRVFAQDVLIYVSEEIAGQEQQQHQHQQQRVLVLALEAAVYNIPTTKSCVVSIVKVDTTARGKRPAPTTALVRAFIGFYVDPISRPVGGIVERVWVHLFARSQGQYLFPGSSEFEGKRVLSPEKLCKWWKSVLSGVRLTGPTKDSNDDDSSRSRYWWLIPGLDEREALQAIGELHAPGGAKVGTPGAQGGGWTYGHPYSQKDIPLPYVQDETVTYNLAHFIPSFDDDPKTRFMDELACTTTQSDGVQSPKKKRPKTTVTSDASSASTSRRKAEGAEEANEQLDSQLARERELDTKPHGELGSVSTDEFWERMSFRQECISGALTGFFVAVFQAPSARPAENPLAPQPGQVSFQMNRRIIMSMHNTDFSSVEGAIRGTEILENAIRGMCEGTAAANAATTTTTEAESGAAPRRLEASDLPPPSLDRRTPEREMTRGSASSQLAPPPPRNTVLDDVSPNPFPEPIASTDTYHAFIYGSIITENPEQMVAGVGSDATSATPKVTQLAVRKKVKKK